VLFRSDEIVLGGPHGRDRARLVSQVGSRLPILAEDVDLTIAKVPCSHRRSAAKSRGAYGGIHPAATLTTGGAGDAGPSTTTELGLDGELGVDDAVVKRTKATLLTGQLPPAFRSAGGNRQSALAADRQPARLSHGKRATAAGDHAAPTNAWASNSADRRAWATHATDRDTTTANAKRNQAASVLAHGEFHLASGPCPHAKNVSVLRLHDSRSIGAAAPRHGLALADDHPIGVEDRLVIAACDTRRQIGVDASQAIHVGANQL
jgi:hypothetical protein